MSPGSTTLGLNGCMHVAYLQTTTEQTTTEQTPTREESTLGFFKHTETRRATTPL